MKTNIGHTEGAAGVAGVIKTVLSMQHKQIPAHLNFRSLNPSISLDEIPAKIPTELMDWHPIDGKRIAGVSSFGISGTNAHVILEEAPKPVELSNGAIASKTSALTVKVERPVQVLWLSGKSEEALKDLAKLYEQGVLKNDSSISLISAREQV